MDIIIAILFILWLIPRLVNDKIDSGFYRKEEEKFLTGSIERKDRWLARVVNNDEEARLRKLIEKWDRETMKEVEDTRPYYGDSASYVNALDILLAKRGYLSRESAEKGLTIAGKENDIKRRLVFAAKLNEELKKHGICEDIYLDQGCCDLLDKLDYEKKANGDCVYTSYPGVIESVSRNSSMLLPCRIKWDPSISLLDKSSNNRKRKARGELDKCLPL